MSKFKDRLVVRMGWTDVSSGLQHWLIWFMLCSVVGGVLEWAFEVRISILGGVALAVVLHFVAKLIVNPSKRKEE